jgi:hypothetical protein
MQLMCNLTFENSALENTTCVAHDSSLRKREQAEQLSQKNSPQPKIEDEDDDHELVAHRLLGFCDCSACGRSAAFAQQQRRQIILWNCVARGTDEKKPTGK